MSRTLTLEATNPDTYMNITVGVPESELILRSYRVDLLASSTIPYRDLGISIGGIINSTYIIDNIPGSNFFRLPLSTTSSVTVGAEVGAVKSCFVPNCHIPLTMSGALEQKFFFRVYYLDRTLSNPQFILVPVTDLKYIQLTFEAVKF